MYIRYMRLRTITLRIGRGLIAFCLLLLVLCPTFTTIAQEKAAYVLDINGEWYVEGNIERNLQRGGSLSKGAIIKARSPEQVSHFIIIADINGRIIDRRYCRDVGACNNPIHLPVTTPQQSLLSRLFDATIKLWGSDPVKYKTFGSRDSSGMLREAVIPLSKGQVDVKAAFAGMPEGKYWVRFVAAPCKDISKCVVFLGPVEFQWAPDKSSSLAAPNLTPGLYEVQLWDKEVNQATQTGTEAWVLVSSPPKFETLSALYREAVKLTREWDASMTSMNRNNDAKSIKRTTVSSFLRAVLDHLAMEAKEKVSK